MLALGTTVFERGLLDFIISSAVTVVLCSLLDRFSMRCLERNNRRHADRVTTNQYLNLTLRFLIWFVGGLVILRQIKPLRPLGDVVLGATGIIAAALGIAAQDAFGNYIAGFVLAIHQPFKVGDVIYLKENKIAGTVKEISFRHTVVESKTGTLLTIPNTEMNTAIIEDLTCSGYARPIEIKVSAKTDLDRLTELIEEALKACQGGEEKAFDITIDGFEDGGFKISFPLTAGSLGEYTQRRTEVMKKLSRLLQENHIELV